MDWLHAVGGAVSGYTVIVLAVTFMIRVLDLVKTEESHMTECSKHTTIGYAIELEIIHLFWF